MLKNAGFALVLLILAASPLLAQEEPAPPFFAKVISITASNSLIVEADGGERRQVVLAFLSIPINEQPYSARAHQILRAQLLNRRVSIRPIGKPKDQYTLGLVYVGSENFNLDFLSRGHAWVDYYQISHPAWLAAQRSAKEAGRGLYADPDATHPLDWAVDFRKAQTVIGITDIMQQDPAFPSILEQAYIGNRKEKVFVPLTCLSTWAIWPRSTLIPFTTVAGAEDNGYVLKECS